MVKRGRALILIGATLAAFAGAYNAGRALRPPGAPAAPPSPVSSATATVRIRVPPAPTSALPPLAVPRPRHSASKGRQPSGGAPQQEGDFTAPRSQPEGGLPHRDAPAPSQPDGGPGSGSPETDGAATPSRPPDRPDDDGDWSSGN